MQLQPETEPTILYMNLTYKLDVCRRRSSPMQLDSFKYKDNRHLHQSLDLACLRVAQAEAAATAFQQ